jgi:FtsH-binding integral membrane protein
MTEHAQMKSIWYLVGLMLLAMGAVITVAGIVQYLDPESVHTVLSELHPSLWWGLIMLASGALFAVAGKNRMR